LSNTNFHDVYKNKTCRKIGYLLQYSNTTNDLIKENASFPESGLASLLPELCIKSPGLQGVLESAVMPLDIKAMSISEMSIQTTKKCSPIFVRMKKRKARLGWDSYPCRQLNGNTPPASRKCKYHLPRGPELRKLPNYHLPPLAFPCNF
jgi:hypothetical protein